MKYFLVTKKGFDYNDEIYYVSGDEVGAVIPQNLYKSKENAYKKARDLTLDFLSYENLNYYTYDPIDLKNGNLQNLIDDVLGEGVVNIDNEENFFGEYGKNTITRFGEVIEKMTEKQKNYLYDNLEYTFKVYEIREVDLVD